MCGGWAWLFYGLLDVCAADRGSDAPVSRIGAARIARDWRLCRVIGHLSLGGISGGTPLPGVWPIRA